MNLVDTGIAGCQAVQACFYNYLLDPGRTETYKDDERYT